MWPKILFLECTGFWELYEILHAETGWKLLLFSIIAFFLLPGPHAAPSYQVFPRGSFTIFTLGLEPLSLAGKASCAASKWLRSCPTLCNPMDYSLPGSSIHGILQARMLEWVAMSSSRGSSWPRDWTCSFLYRQVSSSPLSHQGSPTLLYTENNTTL